MDTNVMKDNDLDDMEGLLASLSQAEAEENGTVLVATSEPETIEDSVLEDQDLEAIVAAETRATAYSDQTSELGGVDGDAQAAAAKVIETPKPARKKSSASPVARVSRSLDDLADEIFLRDTTDTDAPAAKIAMRAKRPAQVKVAEKFDNLFQSLAAGTKPSRYVVIAYKLLSKTGSMTSADLIAAMRAEGLGAGTAQSQTGQVMALFNAVGVADRVGQALTLRPTSAVAKRLSEVTA